MLLSKSLGVSVGVFLSVAFLLSDVHAQVAELEAGQVRRANRPSAINQQILLSIDFQHAGGIYGRTKCDEPELEAAFPGMKVKSSMVYMYGFAQEGYTISQTDSTEPTYTIACTHINPETGYQTNPPKETDCKVVFAIQTRSDSVTAPYNSTIGTTTYQKVKDFDWRFEGQVGCRPGNYENALTLFCIEDRIRMLFELPSDYKGKIEDAPIEVTDRAVLSEVLFWATD